MSRIEALNQRFAASAALVAHGVEVVVVGDPAGARLNAVTRRLLFAIRDDGPGLWDDLVGAVKSLRWRLVAQPQPIELNPALRQGAEQVGWQVRRLRGAMEDDALLDEVVAGAQAVTESDPPIGDVLLRSIKEIGSSECVVVAVNRPARVAIGGWLHELGAPVLTVGELEREQPRVEQAYAIGPPRFFRSSLVTAPIVSSVSFLMPAWFNDRSIPRSAIAAYADGAIDIEARTFTEGDVTEPESATSEVQEAEDDFLPQPVWDNRRPGHREPTADEVEARKLLLSGNLALWLDDGERIRALDPEQPVGERVTYVEVNVVRAGTCLLLRTGVTERLALHLAALGRLRNEGAAVDASQTRWKQALQSRLTRSGYRAVVNELRSCGVKTADRARAWTEPNLIRPNSDHDFELLLQWLGIPIQPSLGYATMLRRALYQASADVREKLERAASAADLSILERNGHMSLDVETEGFRGIVATRVLAMSPNTEIVARHDARVPFEDRSGQWLD